MDELYREWADGRGWGGCWGWVGSRRQAIPSTRSAVSSVGHRNCHSQPETDISSSLTPQAPLLVPINGPIDPVVDRYGFTGSAKDRL